jgi:hypothetical protein
VITRVQIDEQYGILKRMYQDGRLPKPSYMKCLVALAYEHAVLDEMEDVRVLLSQCDESYLTEHLPAQMREDSTFHQVALYVARKLSSSGGVSMVSDEDLMLAFAKTGRA